jgi:hypothetical protein
MKFQSLVAAFVVAFCLTYATPARAQQSVVEQAKTDLLASGFDANRDAACVDFEIAKIVAGRLAAQGAGLLTKDCCGDFTDPNRTHCELNGHGYSHDIVAFPNGVIVDIAIGDGRNSPSWQVADPDASLISRYRSAASLGLTGVVNGAPNPNPGGGNSSGNSGGSGSVAPAVVDLRPLQDSITALRDQVSLLEAKLVALTSVVAGEQSERTSQSDAIKLDLDSLKSRKVPSGCRVQFLACRLTE